MLTEEQIAKIVDETIKVGSAFVDSAGVTEAIKKALALATPQDTHAGIPLQINPMWKWAAMDKSTAWYVYMEKPIIHLEEEYWAAEEDELCRTDCASVILPPQTVSEWQDSLHQIIDGCLVKYVDIPADGEPVIVWSYGRERKRYSAGKLTEYGSLTCYDSGCTKWTAEASHCSWENWRRPTQKELNQ